MILDYLGLVILTVLGGVRLRMALNGSWWSLSLLVHTMIAAFLLVLHSKPKRSAPLLQRLIAWVSALLPLAFQIGVEIPIAARIISLSGVILAIWSLLTLGKSFDIAPVDRGLVSNGPYQIIRHPMYASELLSIVSMVIFDLTATNVLLTIGLIATIVLRIHWEETIISGYQPYGEQVRSRIIPGVW